jgi:predicted 2-oxoglutarate/Fe(II)-dependent dioxygenase YbiX|tara:strand:+ start:1907 stop:2491 length:585 start_codon:yes stop_codon:yes gene_type:complete
MEVKNYLHDYIKVYDDFISKDQLEIFTRICKDQQEFQDGKINTLQQETIVDKKVRRVKIWHLEHLETNNYTQIHWTNFFGTTFQKAIKKYSEYFKLNDNFYIQEMQVLKYTEGGHYNFHVDSGITNPRTISCIFFVNDDYEGGNLLFKFPNEEQTLVIEKIKNRMIVWPSNFLYPHAVAPVTKGERYSIVTWAK